MSCCSGRRMGRYGTTVNVAPDGSFDPRQFLPNDVRINIPGAGTIDIHGNPVGMPTDVGPLDELTYWVKSNPLLALGGAALAVWAIKR